MCKSTTTTKTTTNNMILTAWFPCLFFVSVFRARLQQLPANMLKKNLNASKHSSPRLLYNIREGRFNALFYLLSAAAVVVDLEAEQYHVLRSKHMNHLVFFISLIADGPHHYHPACCHKGSSHLSPVPALHFFYRDASSALLQLVNQRLC